ncbi:MAG: hypothetical protein ABIZ72_05530 [Candidatus Limnocylindrales bacterium]
MRWSVDVECAGDARRGWTCFAAIRTGHELVSEHDVRVAPGDLARLSPRATDPTDLVERSIGFLLEREPPTSILRAFDLVAIARFFPEYESTIRTRPDSR